MVTARIKTGRMNSTVSVFLHHLVLIQNQALMGQVCGKESKYWGFSRGRLGPASAKTLAGDSPTQEGGSDAVMVSKESELRQISPEVLSSETQLLLGRDTCHSYTSHLLADLFLSL